MLPYILLSCFGLAFGSFLNVCIVRLPRKESVISPRSHCPQCQHPIRWYDNVPVASYLLLGGRCRDCHTRISPLYPAVEALTAVLMDLTYYRYGFSPEFVKAGILVMLLLILILTDLRERRIPHPVTLLGIGLGLLLSFFIPVDNRPLEWLFRRAGWYLEGAASSMVGSLAGALVGGGLFYAVGEAFYLLGGRQKEYLGFGDVMLMLMVGSFLGVPMTLMTILLGSLLGTFLAVPLTLASARLRDYPWPYGTFLGCAAIYVSLDGARLLEAYLRWSGFAT